MRFPRQTLLAPALLLLLQLCSAVAHAAIDVYDFNNDQQRQRYQQLTKELRCPKCQNQDIADSNAPIAADLRREVHRMVLADQSDADIIKFMTDRYGDFVIYRPRFDAATALLWLGPAAVGLIGLTVVIGMVRSQRRKAALNNSVSSSEQQQLDQLLNDRENPSS